MRLLRQGTHWLRGLCVTVPVALALRRFRHGPPGDEEAVVLRRSAAVAGGAACQGPRNLTVFSQDWQAMRAAEHRGYEKMTEEVQLVLGVFTVGAEQQHREVIRRTWMDQPGLCRLTDGQRKGCSAYVAFIMGSRDQSHANQLEAYSEYSHNMTRDPNKEDGMLVLNASDITNEGKTFEFFRFVSEHYPWATHVAKCDSDTYPAIRRLVTGIHKESSCMRSPYMYAGLPGYCPKCAGFKRLPPEEVPTAGGEGGQSPKSSAPGSKTVAKDTPLCRARDDGGCAPPHRKWTHHLGQLYVVSMPLVLQVAVRGGIWERPPFADHEDVIAANAIHAFVQGQAKRNNETCLHVWSPQAWCHRGLCTRARAGLFDRF